MRQTPNFTVKLSGIALRFLVPTQILARVV
jgi:hypothetical protein